jgi:AcrR family transcriptional regulator
MDNRSTLLKCALELFAARGYDGVGVQEIVEAAGVTKPTLYYYFGSKQGLLQALLEEYAARLQDALREAAAYQGDLTGSLMRVAKAFFDFAQVNPTYYRMQMSMWFAPMESDPFQVIAGLNEQQYRIIEDLFFQAARDHGNMRGRHQAYALTFIGMLNTYITLWLNGYNNLLDDQIHRVVHQFEHGIYS